MCSRRIAVLKFGGSVLQSPVDVARVAQEIYRWRRKGFQVVAVVSAIGNTTDRLTRTAKSFEMKSDPHKFATLLATGERQSAALVGLGLDRAGLTSAVCDEVQLGIRTTGNPLDADPVALDCDTLVEQLEVHGVVVVPGFIGRDENDRVCLLGRGGSDLTALFIAKKIGAAVCRLIKDVAGLYEFDPKLAGKTNPRRFAHVSYDLALHLDESIVQHKGVKFARRERLSFEVGAIFSDEVTVVGEFENSTFARKTKKSQPVRLALLGFGTVGGGVWHRLTESLSDKFEIVSVAVRDIESAKKAGVPESILTNDPYVAINSNCQIVVELIGGTELPYQLVKHALETGRHVATANKSLLAQFGIGLTELSRDQGVSIAGSAAVGGAAHVLEAIRESVGQGNRVSRIRGLLNGTTNFVLERIADGATLVDAVEGAKLAGFAEADPQRDLDGTDAAEKLVLIARECGVMLRADEVVCQVLDEATVRAITGNDQVIQRRLPKQVVSWDLNDSNSIPRVCIEQVDVTDPLYAVHGAANRILISLETGETISVSGVGAGRYATATAVIADLIDIADRVNQPKHENATLEPELASTI